VGSRDRRVGEIVTIDSRGFSLLEPLFPLIHVVSDQLLLLRVDEMTGRAAPISFTTRALMCSTVHCGRGAGSFGVLRLP
jgi:hypothetical protein